MTCLPLCYSLLVSFYLVPDAPSCFLLLSILPVPPILTASSTAFCSLLILILILPHILYSTYSLMLPPTLYSSCYSYSFLLSIPFSAPDTAAPPALPSSCPSYSPFSMFFLAPLALCSSYSPMLSISLASSCSLNILLSVLLHGRNSS